MKRWAIMLMILTVAAACGTEKKSKPKKYDRFKLSVVSTPKEEIPLDSWAIVQNLADNDGGTLNVRMDKGDVPILKALSSLPSRKFQVDFAKAENGESLISNIILNWENFPYVRMNGCLFGYEDVVTLETGASYRLGGETVGNSIVSTRDCEGKLIGNIYFRISGPNAATKLVCQVNGFPNPLEAKFSSDQTLNLTRKPYRRHYICNPQLSDGSMLITVPNLIPAGYIFFGGAYTFAANDISQAPNNFIGFSFWVDDGGNVIPINTAPAVIPPTPPTPPLPPAPVLVTDITMMVRGYAGLQNQITAFCSFYSPPAEVNMLPTYASDGTTVIAWSYTYSDVLTDTPYGCYFEDTVTGQQIYYPPPSTQGSQYIITANGYQVVENIGNNVLVYPNQWGQLLLSWQTVIFTFVPSAPLIPPVYLKVGNFGLFRPYPMTLQGNSWQAGVSIPQGYYEHNALSNNGADGLFLTFGAVKGEAYVNGGACGLTAPGLRLDPNVNAVTYSSLYGQPQSADLVNSKNYFFSLTAACVYPQSATLTSTSLNISQ